jgi:hypothetical protein
VKPRLYIGVFGKRFAVPALAEEGGQHLCASAARGLTA